MNRKISGESVDFLTDESVDFLIDELSCIIKMLRLALLALENEENELLPTALEVAYVELQGLVDEFCIVDE